MRLIDADALKKAIIKHLCVKSENNLLPAEKSIYDLIDKQHTVEPERKKGKWQPYKHGDDTWHQCSACGVADRYINIVKRDGYPDYRMVCKRNFCPNCGADMRGEQE